MVAAVVDIVEKALVIFLEVLEGNRREDYCFCEIFLGGCWLKVCLRWKKMQNELYRLTFCENVLKIALGTQPQRPQLGSEGFPGRLVFWRSGVQPGKNDVMRCCVLVVDLVFLIFDAGVVRAVAGSCTLSDC